MRPPASRAGKRAVDFAAPATGSRHSLWLLTLFVAATLAWLFAAPRASASDDPAIELESMVGSGRLDAEVLGAVRSGRTADVIVVFDDRGILAKSAIRRGLAGLPADTSELIARRAAEYSDLKQGVVAGAAGVLFADYPNLGLQHGALVSPEEVLALLKSRAVLAVRANRERTANLASSLPYINQPAAVAQGKTGQGTAVAVLDTGVDYTRAAFGHCTAPGVPAATCRVAFARDFTPTDDGALDAHGHGSNVAGIVAGVAPSTRLLALDVFRGNVAFDSDILAAINWVIAKRATFNTVAANMSFADSSYWTAQCSNSLYNGAFGALRAAGVLPVVAAGNGAQGLTNPLDLGLAEPACASGAVSVGAVYDSNIGGVGYGNCSDPATAPGRITCFSQTASYLSVLAPGADVTAAGATLYGTSQAAAHVAGAIAIMASAAPGSSPAQRENAITGSGALIVDHRPAANGIAKRSLDVCLAVAAAGGGCITGTPPVITSLAPSAAVAGGRGFKLQVYGANFLPGATVQWGGASRPTTYVNSGKLLAFIDPADISAVGPVAVTVVNPDLKVSAGATFQVIVQPQSLSRRRR